MSTRITSTTRSHLVEWASTGRVLDKKAALIEEAIKVALDRLQSQLPFDLRAHEQDIKRMELARHHHLRLVFVAIRSIREKLRLAKDTGTNVDDNVQPDLSKLETLLMAVDEGLTTFKAARSIEFAKMAEQMGSIETSISIAMDRIDGWESSTSVAQSIPAVSIPASLNSIQPADQPFAKNEILNQVHAIQNLIDIEGGQYGNWEPEDHRHFLKLRHSLGNVQELCLRGSNEIHNHTFETILDHCSWFDRYTAYIARKNELIKEWRELKTMEQMKSIQSTVIDQKEQDAATARLDHKIKTMLIEKERSIQKWKETKQQAREREACQWAEAKEIKEQAERRRRNRQIKKARKELEQYKLAKQLEEQDENEIVKKVASNAVRPNADTLKKVEIRNASLLARRRHQMERKSQADHMREAALVTAVQRLGPGVRAKRDVTRLLQDTKASIIRKVCDQMHEKDGGNEDQRFRNMQMIGQQWARGVPQWRQGL